MGGRGSGRYYGQDLRPTLDDVQQLDISVLRRDGVFRWAVDAGTISWKVEGRSVARIGYSSSPTSIVLRYVVRYGDADPGSIATHIPVEHTPCNFGGTRPWFRCPECDQRVATLYRPSLCFKCQHCVGIPYASQNEPIMDRMIRTSRKVRAGLGRR